MTKKRNPDETVHLQVKPWHTAVFEGRAYGDRGTLQMTWREAERMLKDGDVVEVDPAAVPDAGAVRTAP
jgi:hypothetical protein